MRFRSYFLAAVSGVTKSVSKPEMANKQTELTVIDELRYELKSRVAVNSSSASVKLLESHGMVPAVEEHSIEGKPWRAAEASLYGNSITNKNVTAFPITERNQECQASSSTTVYMPRMQSTTASQSVHMQTSIQIQQPHSSIQTLESNAWKWMVWHDLFYKSEGYLHLHGNRGPVLQFPTHLYLHT